MKLLHQTQRLFFRGVLPVFMAAGVVSFFTLSWVFDHETDEKLLSSQAEIESYVLANDTLPVFFQTVFDRWYAEPMPFLAETLVTNLLTNAIKHNLTGGWLRVAMNANSLIVENSAAPPEGSATDLTARFARGNPHSEGVGLGLAMVLEICEQQGFGIEMGFEQGVWSVQVLFKK